MKLSNTLRNLLDNFPNDDVVVFPSGKKACRAMVEEYISILVRAERNDDASVLLSVSLATGYEAPRN